MFTPVVVTFPHECFANVIVDVKWGCNSLTTSVVRSYELLYKKLSYRRETARQLRTSFSAHSLIVHFTEHHICFTTI